MRARSASGGWEGRIAAIDDEAGRATLEAGAVRVALPVSDLVPPDGDGAGSGAARRPRSGRRGELAGAEAGGRAGSVAGSSRRAGGVAAPGTAQLTGRSPSGGRQTAGRRVPNSLDLRGARVDEALELLDRYVDQAAVAGAGRVTVVHGHGSGALRDAVRALLSGHPLVREWRPGERGEGGDGATVVEL
jgi:hypothetical protein